MNAQIQTTRFRTATPTLEVLASSCAPTIRERCCHVRLGDLPIRAEFTHNGVRMRKLANDGYTYSLRENRSTYLGNESMVEPELAYAYVGVLPVGTRFRLVDGSRWLTVIDDQAYGDEYATATTERGHLLRFPGKLLVVLDHQQIDE